MSAVTTERSAMKKSKARRCLFGPVDHESVRKDLNSQLNMDNEESKTWNFDFNGDVPLEGRYEWTEVNNDYVPEFYRKGYISRVPPTPRKMNVRPQLNSSSVVLKKPTAVRRLNNLFSDSLGSGETTTLTNSVTSSDSVASSFTPVVHPTPRTPRSTNKRSRTETGSQSTISDFMSIRKRRIDCDSPSTNQRKLPRI